MAQNAEEEGQDAEQQNLDQKLNVEWDTERIAGTAEIAWEKTAVGNKMETEKNKTTVQPEKRTARCKRTSVFFLTSPILSHSPPVHMYSPSSPLYYLQGPYPYPTTSHVPTRSYLNSIGWT
jgi:hypothetical protein